MSAEWLNRAENGPIDAAVINAAPEALRRYIHDVETMCDESGYVQKLGVLETQNMQLVALLAEYQERLDVIASGSLSTQIKIEGLNPDEAVRTMLLSIEPMSENIARLMVWTPGSHLPVLRRYVVVEFSCKLARAPDV